MFLRVIVRAQVRVCARMRARVCLCMFSFVCACKRVLPFHRQSIFTHLCAWVWAWVCGTTACVCLGAVWVLWRHGGDVRY